MQIQYGVFNVLNMPTAYNINSSSVALMGKYVYLIHVELTKGNKECAVFW